MNAEVQRCTTRIAQEEVARIIRENGLHKLNAQVRQECVDRLIQVIDIAVQDEVEMIERDLQVD